ncbi:MAG: sodium:solute symporter family protein [Sporomusaceae bacterium]|nr:sodium:solute symporter family protein [Sporomusaceae bacterium]
MELSFSQGIILVGTVAAVIGWGIYSARQVRSAEGFSLGGRSAGSAMIAGTIAGTAVGGASTIGTAQLAFLHGLSAWWFTLGSGIGLLLLGLFYARALRQSGLETISQYLVVHYGRTAGPITSLISSLGILLSVVASSLSGISLLAGLLSIPPWQAAGLIVILVVAYVFFGGLKGAGVAGLLKLLIIWLSLFAAGGAAVYILSQRPDCAVLFPADPWFNLFGEGLSHGLENLFSLIVGIVCTQTYIQAVYAATNVKTALIGTCTAAAIIIPVGLPSVAVGMFMHVYHPDILPILALPMYLTTYLPSWIGGIGLAGLLLSVVGSIAGLVLGIGTMIARDIAADLFQITNSSRLLWLNRCTVVVVTGLSMAIALTNLDSLVLDWNFMSMALRGGGVFIPLTLAVFYQRPMMSGWVQGSILFSTAVAVYSEVYLSLPFPPLFVGLLVSALILLSGFLWPKAKAKLAEVHEV